jgi:DNA-binding PadR family transcriptional regulator
MQEARGVAHAPVPFKTVAGTRMELEKDLVAASATPLVLAILTEGESYGYAIIKRVAELSQGEMQWTDGMVYPLLHRLERNGFVEAVWGKSESGRSRKYYRLTPAGRTHLDNQRRQWQVVDHALRGIWKSVTMVVDTAGAIASTLVPAQERTLCRTT